MLRRGIRIHPFRVFESGIDTEPSDRQLSARERLWQLWHLFVVHSATSICPCPGKRCRYKAFRQTAVTKKETMAVATALCLWFCDKHASFETHGNDRCIITPVSANEQCRERCQHTTWKCWCSCWWFRLLKGKLYLGISRLGSMSCQRSGDLSLKSDGKDHPTGCFFQYVFVLDV